ncbi:MAG: hypothetical protein ACR2QF_05220, partial [Geminicoccaceae bacterium]
LSPERVDGLLDGAGLGYAKAAELNGWPGPLHVLELADALDLSADQYSNVSAIRASMLAKAKKLGEDLIAAEAALNALFLVGSPDLAAVTDATAKIGSIEAELRAAHLAAHLETKPLLSRHQRMIYAKHRGYDGGHDSHSAH